jgi:hypothetical protein
VGHRPHGVERRAYRGLCRGEPSSVRVRAARQADRHREARERLLRAVVEVPLEPPPLGVRRTHDRGARGAQPIELGALLGLEALMVDRQPGRAAQFLDQPRIVQEAWPMNHDGDHFAVLHERRLAAVACRGLRPPPAGRVDPAVFERVGELERRVLESGGQQLAQPTWAHGA